VAELHGAGLAPVFTADTDFQLRAHPPPVLDSDPDEAANADSIENLKWIVGKDTTFEVRGKETARIVAAEAERLLRKVVCAEGKEFGLPRNLISGQRGARELDHRTDQVMDGLTHRAEHLLGGFLQYRALVVEFAHGRNERYHDFRPVVDAETRRTHSSLEDRPSLHLGDLGKCDPETAASMSEHWIRLTQRLDDTREVGA
jgi:hypothetical protein